MKLYNFVAIEGHICSIVKVNDDCYFLLAGENGMFRVKCTGTLADDCISSLTPGCHVLVSGELIVEKENTSESKKNEIYISGKNVNFLKGA